MERFRSCGTPIFSGPHVCESFDVPPTRQMGRYVAAQRNPTPSPLFPRSRHPILGIFITARSKVVDSNFRPNSRARRQDIFSSVRDGRRAISAYLSRYLALAESQKLSGWNTGTAGMCSAIHSNTG